MDSAPGKRGSAGQFSRDSWTESLENLRSKGKLQLPAESRAIDAVRADSQSLLRYDIPREYQEFLKVTNGVHFNGFSVYGSRTYALASKGNILGFVATNQTKWEVEPNLPFVFFGGTGDEEFVFDRRSGKFAELDHPSNDVIQEFASFSEMLAYILHKALTA